MIGLKVYAIVPVKGATGKSRLSTVLDREKRKKLVLLMLDDVIHSLKESRFLSGIIVVSPDDEILHFSKKYSCITVKEPPMGLGLNSAVKLGVNMATAMGATAVLIVHADIPLINESDIDYIIREGHKMKAPFIIIVPSRDGGTSILMLSLPSAFTFKYGEESFKRHLAEAKRLGLTVKVLQCERASLDLDDANDIALILNSNLEKKTIKFLRSIMK